MMSKYPNFRLKYYVIDYCQPSPLPFSHFVEEEEVGQLRGGVNGAAVPARVTRERLETLGLPLNLLKEAGTTREEIAAHEAAAAPPGNVCRLLHRPAAMHGTSPPRAPRERLPASSSRHSSDSSFNLALPPEGRRAPFLLGEGLVRTSELASIPVPAPSVRKGLAQSPGQVPVHDRAYRATEARGRASGRGLG